MNSDMKCPLQPISKTSSKGMGARSGPPRRVRGLNPNARSRKTWILDLSHRSKQARGRRKTRTRIQIWYALRETAWDSRKKEGMKNHEWFRSGGCKEGRLKKNELTCYHRLHWLGSRTGCVCQHKVLVWHDPLPLSRRRTCWSSPLAQASPSNSATKNQISSNIETEIRT